MTSAQQVERLQRANRVGIPQHRPRQHKGDSLKNYSTQMPPLLSARPWRESPETTRIPRILHQTFPSAAVPEHLAESIERLRARNPGWSYRLYDDADIERFIDAEFGAEMLAVYRSIAAPYGAARADLFRYLVIYRCGGVYLDIKSTADRPLDEVIGTNDAFIVTQWDNEADQEHAGWGLRRAVAHVPGGEFEQWFIAAAPGHPFLAAVIDKVVARIRDYRPLRDGVGIRVVDLTGPVVYTRAIAPLLGRFAHRRVRNHLQLGLRYTVMGYRAHRALFSGHYTQSIVPMVDQPRPLAMRWFIAAVLRIKRLRRRVLGYD